MPFLSQGGLRVRSRSEQHSGPHRLSEASPQGLKHEGPLSSPHYGVGTPRERAYGKVRSVVGMYSKRGRGYVELAASTAFFTCSEAYCITVSVMENMKALNGPHSSTCFCADLKSLWDSVMLKLAVAHRVLTLAMEKAKRQSILLMPDFWTDLESAIKKAYHKTNSEILKNAPMLEKGGLIAVTAILIGSHTLIAGNVGDSRAMIRKNGEAKQLSVHHDLGKERKYIDSRGGFVPNRPGNCRGRGRSRGRHGGHGGLGRGRGEAAAYTAQAAVDDPRQLEGEAGRPVILGLSSDQVEKLLSLIDVPKAGCEKLLGKGDRLLDSGASYHMTGDIGKLSNVYDTHLTLVGMPNG
ncbi:hypothetical protein Cgig2_008890 [Carnegiea gigantea]|uniref:PPM-type phosphatase domain-containing protein n=1 Tax=Carnegiea gigantea TaxID=171969 RepID=A0A9Q1KK45_9CARY|nr:hypothetical protein Cgig2_008890 [Carnegiea gigantea]